MRLDEIASTDDLVVIQEEAQVAIDQVERLSKVVDDLMGRTRVSDPARPSVSLDAVLASLQREWQPAFASSKRSMRIHGERGLRVRATPVALAQILSTLVENALAHGRGTVDIAARRAGPSVVIEPRRRGRGRGHVDRTTHLRALGLVDRVRSRPHPRARPRRGQRRAPRAS